MPLEGPGGVRDCYLRFKAPFRWYFLKELVEKDLTSKDAARWQREWDLLVRKREKPLVLQVLAAPDPAK